MNVLVHKYPDVPSQRFDNVSIEVKGGDAPAVAECANQGKSGNADVTLVHICMEVPIAVGGTLHLTHANITIRAGS